MKPNLNILVFKKILPLTIRGLKKWQIKQTKLTMENGTQIKSED